MKFSKLDKKILYLISHNCRYSYSDIGKKLNISRQLVKNHIDSFIDSGIITGFRLTFNESKLGILSVLILVRIQITEKLIDFLKNNENIYYISEAYNKWNLYLWGNFESKDEIEKFLSDLYSNFIVMAIEILYDKNITSYKPLFDDFFQDIEKLQITKATSGSFEKYLRTSDLRSKKQIKLTDNHKNVLNLLRENSRYSISDLAALSGYNRLTVSSYIKDMILSGVILSFVPSINQLKLGYFPHYLLLKLNEHRVDELNKMVKLIGDIGQVGYVGLMDGFYNMIVEYYIKDISEIRKVYDLLNAYQNIIEEFELCWSIKEYKFNGE